MMENQPNTHFTIKDLKKFAVIRSQHEIDTRKEYFKNPVLCHYYEVVNEALRLEKLILKP